MAKFGFNLRNLTPELLIIIGSLKNHELGIYSHDHIKGTSASLCVHVCVHVYLKGRFVLFKHIVMFLIKRGGFNQKICKLFLPVHTPDQTVTMSVEITLRNIFSEKSPPSDFCIVSYLRLLLLEVRWIFKFYLAILGISLFTLA